MKCPDCNHVYPPVQHECMGLEINRLRSLVAELRELLMTAIDWHGLDTVPHEDECPYDDTCDCVMPGRLEKALEDSATP